MAATVVAIAFNGCSDVSFSDFTPVVKPLICDPLSPDGVITDCSTLTNGLVGEIRYFLDKDPATTIPEFVYDTFDNPIAFPRGITEVDQFYSTGFTLNANLILTSLNKPSVRFSEGFKDTQGQIIADENGNPLFEAFSFKLKSYFKLQEDQEEGLYEIGLISDDGAVLKMDTDGDLQLETIVSNDGLHAVRLGCASVPVDLKHGKLHPMEVKYYQGPRQHIALVMVMRKIANADEINSDPLCGFTSTTQWFGNTADPGYQADYVNSKFGELASRGWFIPSASMFILPK